MHLELGYFVRSLISGLHEIAVTLRVCYVDTLMTPNCRGSYQWCV